jgi:CheY-like chemotaxis protein
VVVGFFLLSTSHTISRFNRITDETVYSASLSLLHVASYTKLIGDPLEHRKVEKMMPCSILVVDDDESILEFVSDALSDEGYRVHIAPNGAVALEILAEIKDELCLVLLDMKMPKMDGFAFLEEYDQKLVEHVPVIAFSANAKLNVDSYNIKAFLPKPFDLVDLLNLIEKYAPSSPAQA